MDGRWRDAVLLAEPRRRRRIAKLVRRRDRLEARSAARRPAGGHGRAATAVAGVLLMLGGLFVASMLSEDRSASAIGPPPGPGASDAFAFARTQDDGSEPVTYDPCEPIHLVVDTRTMVDDGMRLLEEALDEVRDATGLGFVIDGLTDEPAPEIALQSGPDGEWTPVTVSWSDPRASKKLKGSITGYAGSGAAEHHGDWWYVSGRVVLDGPQLAKILKRRGGWQSARAVIMHELGHLVGLGHVEAPGQLMQPKADPALTTWGAGDRAGLSALGRGYCVDF